MTVYSVKLQFNEMGDRVFLTYYVRANNPGEAILKVATDERGEAWTRLSLSNVFVTEHPDAVIL